MKTINIIAGLQILTPYYEDPEGCNCGADSCEIYAFPTHNPLSDEDLAKMIELGWHQEYGEVVFGAGFKPSEYRANETWNAYI